MATKPGWKVNDRVRRSNNQGCYGIIKNIRTEVTGSAKNGAEKPVIITVLWDNGTLSQFASEGLEAVSS